MCVYTYLCVYTRGGSCLVLSFGCLVVFFPQNNTESTRPRSISALFEEEQRPGFPIMQQEQLIFSAKIYAAKLMQMADTGRKGCLTAWEIDRKTYGIL